MMSKRVTKIECERATEIASKIPGRIGTADELEGQHRKVQTAGSFDGGAILS
jgi:hypothetical protein